MKRFFVSLIVLVSLTALLVGCGDYDDRNGAMSGDAAVVNGTKITNEQFNKELDALLANEGLVKAVEGQGGAPLTTEDGKVAPALAASWLQQDISWVLIDQMAKDLGVEPTAANRKTAASTAESAYPSPEVWAAFPEWFRDAQVEALAVSGAVVEELTKTKPTDADLQAAYAAIPAEQVPQVQCISHILLPATETAKAAELKKQIDKGADFAELAKANSTDGSKDAGGSLGCLRSDTSNLDPTFQQAADAATVGKVTDPVTSQFGIHLILVTDRHPASVEDLKTELTQQFQSQQIKAYVTKFNEKSKVTVDPHWGTVKLENGQWVVTPPAEATSSTTAPAGSSTTAPAGSSTTVSGSNTTAP